MSSEDLLKLAETFEKKSAGIFEKDPIISKDIMEIKYKINALKNALETISRVLTTKRSISWFKRFMIKRYLGFVEDGIRDIIDSLK